MGMKPKHLASAKKECLELLQQCLIKISNSQWAYKAFYVNKHAEQNRGKMQLVINYQSLKLFLHDKFPLHLGNSLFARLSKAHIYSKFDLKARFWQLSIHHEDKFKTWFCIPNQHFQWKVFPFDVKVAPSLFQKVTRQIFHSILSSAVVYIDDILLSSLDKESHCQLLR